MIFLQFRDFINTFLLKLLVSLDFYFKAKLRKIHSGEILMSSYSGLTQISILITCFIAFFTLACFCSVDWCNCLCIQNNHKYITILKAV